jgi:hypothetical protein
MDDDLVVESGIFADAAYAELQKCEIVPSGDDDREHLSWLSAATGLFYKRLIAAVVKCKSKIFILRDYSLFDANVSLRKLLEARFY